MSLDSQIYQCDINIDRYRKLRNQLETIATYLTASKNSSVDLKNNISNLYQINDEDSNINNRVVNLKNNIEHTCNTINHTIIPSIDSAINRTSNQRYNLQQEKQRQEELARRKED